MEAASQRLEPGLRLAEHQFRAAQCSNIAEKGRNIKDGPKFRVALHPVRSPHGRRHDAVRFSYTRWKNQDAFFVTNFQQRDRCIVVVIVIVIVACHVQAVDVVIRMIFNLSGRQQSEAHRSKDLVRDEALQPVHGRIATGECGDQGENYAHRSGATGFIGHPAMGGARGLRVGPNRR